MTETDPEVQRAESRVRWEEAAAGWGRQADNTRELGMPVSAAMIEQLGLQPGQRVVELAAGPGDTGFLAAELIKPGGTLISSDGAEAMVEVARERGRQLGIDNAEFKQLELEWIDLETASVDAVLCRWGVMLIPDPEAALKEMRRILRPGGRIALAVWDDPALNVWATAPTGALIELELTSPAPPGAPGMFALAAPGTLHEMLEDAGFVDVLVDGVDIERDYVDLDEYLGELFDLSRAFKEALEGVPVAQRAEVKRRIASQLQSYTEHDGSLRLPGRSLVGSASA